MILFTFLLPYLQFAIFGRKFDGESTSMKISKI